MRITKKFKTQEAYESAVAFLMIPWLVLPGTNHSPVFTENGGPRQQWFRLDVLGVGEYNG